MCIAVASLKGVKTIKITSRFPATARMLTTEDRGKRGVMNRSVERRQFGALGTAPGEILVGHHYTHPVRGPVRCPAAPLVSADLRRAGHRVREVSRLHLAAYGDGEGEVFAASYVDPGGYIVGLAAAAPQADEAALAAAREVITTWSAVWRTRRVMMADIQDDCVASPYAREAAGTAPDPRRRGDALAVPGGRMSGGMMTMARAIDSAFGAPGPAWTSGGAAGGATCPHIARARAEAQRFADRGDHVVVIGRGDHGDSSALLALAPGRIVVVESVEDVAALRLPADRVSYLVQPGVAIEEAAAVLASLRRRYPRSRGAHPDHLCYAVSDRLAAIRLVIADSDLTILLGNPDTAASRAMNAPSVKVVDDPTTALRPSWLAAAECVGVASSDSSGVHMSTRLVDILSGLGPLAITHKRVTTRIALSDPGKSQCTPAR